MNALRRGVRNAFGNAVRDVTFLAADREVVATIGASGSGKSTLPSLPGLFNAPDTGSIDMNASQLGNLDVGGRTKYRSSRVGFVFQAFNPTPNRTAKENVKLTLEFANGPKNDRDSRAEEMLTMVGLDGTKTDRRRAKLSGGDQQRVAIARALSAPPQLILADEPTGSLDKEGDTRLSNSCEKRPTHNVRRFSWSPTTRRWPSVPTVGSKSKTVSSPKSPSSPHIWPPRCRAGKVL